MLLEILRSIPGSGPATIVTSSGPSESSESISARKRLRMDPEDYIPQAKEWYPWPNKMV
jgi:hypothetical protein